jgi:MarR family transcriptional regulator, organic hydroperoxide resistance regulator
MVTRPATRGRVAPSTAASDGPVSNALIRVSRLHVMRVRQLLHGLGLHPGHELLLMHLWDAGPQRQTELAVAFDTDSASMTRTVQRLERAGFLRRRPDPNDGRATLVESTPAGMALRSRIQELWAELEADTVGDMPVPQRRQLLHGLQSLEANLSSATAGDTALAPRDADASRGPKHEPPDTTVMSSLPALTTSASSSSSVG